MSLLSVAKQRRELLGRSQVCLHDGLLLRCCASGVSMMHLLEWLPQPRLQPCKILCCSGTGGRLSPCRDYAAHSAKGSKLQLVESNRRCGCLLKTATWSMHCSLLLPSLPLDSTHFAACEGCVSELYAEVSQHPTRNRTTLLNCTQ